MSPDSQRIAIAEACGIVSKDKWGSLYKTPRGILRDCPDYLADLNAMHEAEETLTEHEWNQMFEWLIHIRWRDANATERHGIGKQKALSPARASAAQRAEAFLKTIGKWEGAK